MGYPGYGAQWSPPQVPVAATGSADRAYRWFVVYVIAMMVLCVLYAIGGAFLLLYDFDSLTAAERDELRFQGGILLFIGLGYLVVNAVGLFLPRKPWGWVYGLILIGFGLASCCTWPATIPLMIQWVKPEMKARFGHR